MKTYINDLIPKIKRHSKFLNNRILLTEQNWVLLDINSDLKYIYFFHKDGRLFISKDGQLKTSNWELISNNQLLIHEEGEGLILKNAFLDESILALEIEKKKDM